MPPSSQPRSRSRWTIDRLPSGAVRVRVYAGSDPLTGRRHDLTEIVPPGPRAAAEAEKVRSRLLNQNEAWKDEAWGTMVWLAMTTGVRRGELCALRRRHLDLDEAVLTIESGVAGSRARMREKDTKTHQKRRVALDESTVAILQEHLRRQDRDAAEL